MSFDFNDVLDTPVQDIERPPLPPLGYYIIAVNGVKTRDFKDKEGRDMQALDFTFRGVRAYKDVDPDALKEWGAASNLVLQRSFMFHKDDATEFANAQFQIKQFCEKHLLMDIEGMAFKEMLAKSKGKQCVGEVNLRPDGRDPNVMYANLKATAPIEE